FFFQAEDGIRDRNVTGVQTCALPICDDKGRIYRVYPSGKKLRPIPDLTKLSTTALAYELKTHNGTVRDLIHLELVRRNDPEAVEIGRASCRERVKSAEERGTEKKKKI